METQPRDTAGGVVLNAEGKVIIVRQNGDSWALPKGGVAPDESLLAAARREIFEETGVRATHYLRDLGSYERYSIGKGGVGEQKEFGLRKRTFFLFYTLERELLPRDSEITEARWAAPEEALRMLTHPKDREFFASVVPIIRGLRTKTSEQVACIEAAQRAAESALEEALGYIRASENPTSEGARRAIERKLDTLGYDLPHGCIVAGGAQSAAPHQEGSGVLPRNAPIVLDIYPRSLQSGYFGDLSRTVCLGEPPGRLQKMYDAVLAAQELALSLVRPGRPCQDIQTAVEGYFKDAGFMTSGTGDPKEGFAYAEGFVHSVGHGLGLSIHEPPKVGTGPDVLLPGDVITIEPGLYYTGFGGVRIEDVVTVTEGGCRSLTRAPKRLALE